MQKSTKKVIGLYFLSISIFILAACSSSMPRVTPSPTLDVSASEVLSLREDDVPELPFDDNPDPDQCGIPVRWGLEDPAWLNGYYDGELIQPQVALYDSHLRLEVTGSAPTGTPVRVILYQENPVLDYYMVVTIDMDEKQEGWIPAPFLSFEPPK
jgi:hypothetical protein